MFAEQQVLKAQAAKKAKDGLSQAVRERMWDEDLPSEQADCRRRARPG